MVDAIPDWGLARAIAGRDAFGGASSLRASLICRGGKSAVPGFPEIEKQSCGLCDMARRGQATGDPCAASH